MPEKLHIGGKIPHPEWKILNISPGPNVDYVGNANNLSQFGDKSLDEIYASHVLEHFDYRDELLKTLKEWHRVLQPDGKLYISVPDMDTLTQLFLERNKLTVSERFHVMRMMFGGHTDEHDYHYTGLNFEFLCQFLSQAGFRQVKRVKEFGIFQDTSILKFKEVPVSLNVVVLK